MSGFRSGPGGNIGSADLTTSGVVKSLSNVVYSTATGDVDLSTTTQSSVVLLNGTITDGSDITLPQATTSNGGLVIEIVMGPGVVSAVTTGIRIGVTNAGSTVLSGVVRLACTGGSIDTLALSSGDGNKVINLDSNDHTAGGGGAGSRYTFYYTGIANTVFVVAEGIATTASAAALDGATVSATGIS